MIYYDVDVTFRHGDLARLFERAHLETGHTEFVVVGSLKPTPSHPGEPGIGWDAFARLRETVSLPMYAIGGLGAADLPEASRHGAQGIAAIRAWWG